MSVVKTTSKINGKCQISGSASSDTLGAIFKKICRVTLITSGPHRTCKYCGQSIHWGTCLRMREIVTLMRLFFCCICSMRLATGRPVLLIVVVNGSSDAPSWRRSRPSYGFVIKQEAKLSLG